MFNRSESFYKADIVILMAVRAPSEYRCIVLRAEDAECAAQLNLDRNYRTLTRKGEEKKPHKVWLPLEPMPKEAKKATDERRSLDAEREIIRLGENAWGILLQDKP